MFNDTVGLFTVTGGKPSLFKTFFLIWFDLIWFVVRWEAVVTMMQSQRLRPVPAALPSVLNRHLRFHSFSSSILSSCILRSSRQVLEKVSFSWKPRAGQGDGSAVRLHSLPEDPSLALVGTWESLTTGYPDLRRLCQPRWGQLLATFSAWPVFRLNPAPLSCRSPEAGGSLRVCGHRAALWVLS